MNFQLEKNSRATVLSVSELNRSAKDLLENGLPLMWVSGEISNLKRYDSGHWYFSLKDSNAQVRCVMFRHKNQYLDWQPKDGMQVEVRALVTLYEARGDFQLNVETVRRAGLGALFEAFEKLKAKLDKEGLFELVHKKPLPLFPKQIGIVTSPAAAALRDVLTTLRRRMPAIPLIIYPTPVQGIGAAASIAEAINTAAARAECEVLIVCRGGGSIEDLWAFNEEVVARAIAACPIPVVSGVGHETDFTIADFVADMRAPTPTGAAQLACPDRVEWQHRIMALSDRLQRGIHRNLENRMQKTDLLMRRLVHPGERLKHQSSQTQHLSERLTGAWRRQLENKQWAISGLAQRLQHRQPDLARQREKQHDLAHRLIAAASRRHQGWASAVQHLHTQLAHLNPQAVLERGYSVAYNATGEVVRSSKALQTGDALTLAFAIGRAQTRVTKTEE